MRATDLYRPWLFRGLGFLLGLCISAVSPSLLAEIPESISVQSGQTTHIAIDGLRRVVVGDGSVLGVKPLKGGGLLLAGKRDGETSLLLWGDSFSARRVLVRVRSGDVSRVTEDIRRALGADDGLSLNAIGDQVVVTGTPKSVEQQDRLKMLAERHPKLLNLARADGTEQMIAMEVRFLEIKKNAMEKIGIQWQQSMAGPMVGIVGDMKTNGHFRSTSDGALNGGTPSISPNFPGLESAASAAKVSPFAVYMGLQSTLLSVINLMEQEGDAVVLAEPMLSTRSGGTAKFLAGGEIPLPVTSSLGSGSVQFKPYGIRFEIAPRVTEQGVISANVLTELSTVDPAIRVGDLPGFLSRMTETQVNLKQGETLVMSGLLSEEGSKSIDKLAGLGNIPILGALFRSKDFRDRRSEMVVMITPRLISPQDAFHQKVIGEAMGELDETRRRIHGQAEVNRASGEAADD